MDSFIIRFLICNLLISIIICILFAVNYLLRNVLTAGMKYRLWLLLPGFMMVPFLPHELTDLLLRFSWSRTLLRSASSASAPAAAAIDTAGIPVGSGWMNDFTLSVNRGIPSQLPVILWGIWAAGIAVMLLLTTASLYQLHTVKKSALPLQNRKIRQIYDRCLAELHIKKEIPIFSTAFLRSPILTGLFRPAVYLPISAISCFAAGDASHGQSATGIRKTDLYSHKAAPAASETHHCADETNGMTDMIRYIFLHELQHYRRRDNFVNFIVCPAGILYWFNPFVRLAFHAMRDDRETACDCAVLDLLRPEKYEDYGNTLLYFAGKTSPNPFPFSAGISSAMKQMRKRIINIVSYEKPSARTRRKSAAALMCTAALLAGFLPFLSAKAGTGPEIYYQWNTAGKVVSDPDVSAYFGENQGTFVLYDMENDIWSIYNRNLATLRVSPDSTWKIYAALAGLEEGIITPDNSLIAWDGQIYPFETWNQDQNLQTAMQYSVNWYFQKMEIQMGKKTTEQYLHDIGYGNEDIGSDSSFWLESSLKISPVEQVELLVHLYCNDFDIAPENIDAVKDSIRIASDGSTTLYGKTGTGRINGQDVNGWFIGYVEKTAGTYFFAVNISADAAAASTQDSNVKDSSASGNYTGTREATGSRAAEIALSILNEKNIWGEP